jgi:hypothetical protein
VASRHSWVRDEGKLTYSSLQQSKVDQTLVVIPVSSFTLGRPFKEDAASEGTIVTTLICVQAYNTKHRCTRYVVNGSNMLVKEDLDETYSVYRGLTITLVNQQVYQKLREVIFESTILGWQD